tara:strand:- start:65 stop:1237 length:1173 start_codon:yes stop_codon:yes gene_type:complete
MTNKNIRLAGNTISKNEINLLIQWLKKNEKLTKGKLTINFEKIFSKWLKKKYSIFVNSGSSANLLVAQSLLESGYLKNKTIIAPAVSWITTVAPFLQLGYKVKLCDCDKNNLGLNIKHFEQLCRKYKPSCVILVHVLGHANNMSKIKSICKKFKIRIIEDTCEALGSSIKNKKLGTFGLASTFSFYYGHHISTIEGGMVSTNDKKLYNIMLSVRSHGWGRDLENKEKKILEKKYKIDEVRSLYSFYYSGFNLRSTDLNAFIGLQQIKKIKNIVKIRNSNFKLYSKELEDYWCQKSNSNIISNFGFGTLIENRVEVFNFLKKMGIETRPLICGNIGSQPMWLRKFKKQKLPNAEVIHNYGIYLPNHSLLNKKEIKYICKNFKKVAIKKNFK